MEKSIPDLKSMTLTEKTMYIWKECDKDPNDAIKFIEEVENKYGVELSKIKPKKTTYNGENLLKIPIEWTMKIKKLSNKFSIKELSNYSNISQYVLRKILNNNGKETLTDLNYGICFELFKHDINFLINDIHNYFYKNKHILSNINGTQSTTNIINSSSNVTNYYINYEKLKKFILHKFKKSFKSFRDLSRRAGYRERELSYIFQDLKRKGYTTKRRLNNLSNIIGESVEYILKNFSEQNMKTT